jgi:hypothetical protein
MINQSRCSVVAALSRRLSGYPEVRGSGQSPPKAESDDTASALLLQK